MRGRQKRNQYRGTVGNFMTLTTNNQPTNQPLEYNLRHHHLPNLYNENRSGKPYSTKFSRPKVCRKTISLARNLSWITLKPFCHRQERQKTNTIQLDITVHFPAHQANRGQDERNSFWYTCSSSGILPCPPQQRNLLGETPSHFPMLEIHIYTRYPYYYS